MRKTIPYLLFPLLMGGGIFSTYALISGGYSKVLAYAIVSLVFSFLVLGLEQVFPHRKDWQVRDHQELQDIGHNIFGTVLGAGIGKTLAESLFLASGLWAAGQIGHSLWPTHWHFAAQVLLVYLMADLGRYIQHRIFHKYDVLWRFHALHHSVDKLYVLKNARSHIMERISQPLFMFGALFFMGVPAEVLFCYMMPNSFLGIIDHSNMHVKIGPLSYIINGPAEHRLHHSKKTSECQSNFGSALVIWDMIFGTYTNPRPYDSPKEVGILNDITPHGFWGQVTAPFLPAKKL